LKLALFALKIWKEPLLQALTNLVNSRFLSDDIANHSAKIVKFLVIGFEKSNNVLSVLSPSVVALKKPASVYPFRVSFGLVKRESFFIK